MQNVVRNPAKRGPQNHEENQRPAVQPRNLRDFRGGGTRLLSPHAKSAREGKGRGLRECGRVLGIARGGNEGQFQIAGRVGERRTTNAIGDGYRRIRFPREALLTGHRDNARARRRVYRPDRAPVRFSDRISHRDRRRRVIALDGGGRSRRKPRQDWKADVRWPSRRHAPGRAEGRPRVPRTARTRARARPRGGERRTSCGERKCREWRPSRERRHGARRPSRPSPA